MDESGSSDFGNLFMRKLPPLHAIRAFESAARHLNFTAAADELNVDPTAISHQVRKLEEWLGVTLFHRYPRPLKLSETGAALYPGLRIGLDRMAEAIDAVRGPSDGPLTLSMTMGFAAEWLTPRMARLRAETGLEIEVNAENRVISLAGGDADLAIRLQDEPGRDAVWRHLFDDRLIAVATPDLLAAHGLDPEDGATARRLPLIHYRWASRERPAPSWTNWFGDQIDESKLTSAGEFDEESHAIRGALTSVGAALLSERLVADRLAAGELVQLTDHAIPLPPFWAVYREGHPRRRDIEALIAWLANAARS